MNVACALVFLASHLALMPAQQMLENNATVSLISQSNNALAAKVYSTLAEKNKGNILFSPLSLDTALAALAVGAEGKSYNELTTALDLSTDENSIKRAFKELTDSLQDDKNITMATKLFINNECQIRAEYERDLIDYFNSDLELLDFDGQTDESVEKINQWVEDKTNKRIKDMVSEGDIQSDTVAILINAIYFKSNWAIPFDKENTRKNKFYGLEGESEVDFMYSKQHYGINYDDYLQADLISLPYEGDFKMVLLVPTERDGIIEVEKKLRSALASDNSTLFASTYMSQFYSTEVRLYMPKFKLEVTTRLNDVLQEIGIESIFKACGLTKINDDVVISGVVQKAYINVDETSTEAAAATAINFSNALPSMPTSREIIADHPFIFYIIHEPTNVAVFIGRYSN